MQAYDIIKIIDKYILIITDNNFISRIHLLESNKQGYQIIKNYYPNSVHKSFSGKKEFDKFFHCKTTTLNVEWKLKNISEFQKKVLLETKKIPYGATLSYEEIAKNIGSPRAARAVGTALSRNPLPLIFPCHRVIRKNNQYGGFMGDKKDKTGWKTFLLSLEKNQLLSLPQNI